MPLLQNKKSTKERILDVAFSFFETPCYEPFSLNDIAKKAGISKTAIYRHFQNKEALGEAMKDRFFTILADYIISIKDNLANATWSQDISLYRIILRNSIKIFFKYPQYLFYMLFLIASSPKDCHKLPENFTNKLKERGLSAEVLGPLFGVNYASKNSLIFDLTRHTAFSYSITSIIFFIIVSLSPCQNNLPQEEKDFSEVVADILDFGLYKKENRISYKRMQELDEKAHLDFSDVPPVNPIFSALSEVITQYGMPGVTVERLATVLNMAKSSLYSYSTSKESLVRHLLAEEIAMMIKKIEDVCNNITNRQELAYTFFRSITEYFLARPDVLTVFKWTRMSGSLMPDAIPTENDYGYKSRLDANNLEIFDTTSFKMTRGTFFTWLSVISSTIIMQKDQHKFTYENCFEIVKITFDFIQKGLTNEN